MSGISYFQQSSNFIESLEQVIRDALIQKTDIEKVVITGKSSYVETIKLLINEKLNIHAPIVYLEMLVALGAAIQMGVMTGIVEDILILDGTSRSVGVETQGGVTTIIIPKNTTIPTKKNELFTTAVDGQDNVEINVLEGEKEFAKDNLSLGIFRLNGIPPLPKGVPQVEVKRDFDHNGLLHVTDLEKESGKKLSVSIQ
ncbi:MAG: Hsp70 family protein [Acaryochloris sp. RU_4_1]|nr:Hsp70 family protein [Acaryochloris sp. RU_4_1]